MSPPIPPHCPHEETINSLGNTLRSLASKLDENTGKTDRILDLLQGEDPLTLPGQGMVSKVDELLRDKKEREDRNRQIKALAMTGAGSGLVALTSVAWEWVRAHWK